MSTALTFKHCSAVLRICGGAAESALPQHTIFKGELPPVAEYLSFQCIAPRSAALSLHKLMSLDLT